MATLPTVPLYVLAAGLVAVFVLPTTHEIMQKNLALDKSAEDAGVTWLVWQPSMGWALCTAFLAAASLLLLTRVHEFIYFRF